MTDKEFTAEHLDTLIAVYFSSKTERQKYTLGEYLTEMLPQIGNQVALDYLRGKENHG